MDVVIDGKVPGAVEPGRSDEPIYTVDPDEPIELEKPTPLVSLKERRKQLVSQLWADIRVPRWTDPEIWVRFKPVSAIAWSEAISRRSTKGGNDWAFWANVDMLVEHCIGVHSRERVPDAYEDDGETPLFIRKSLKVDAPDGPWTKFDKDLAEALGLDLDRIKSHADTCKNLYFTEGDITVAANQLLRWSNLANDDADGNFFQP